MVAIDAITVNSDRHAGNYGLLVSNEAGEILGMAPIFDNNMALLPYMMQSDNVKRAIPQTGPKIGTDLMAIADHLMTQEMQRALIELKDFEYINPGFECPDRRIEAANEIKQPRIESLSGRKTHCTPGVE